MAFVLLIVEKREDRLNRPKDVGRGLFDQMIRFATGSKPAGSPRLRVAQARHRGGADRGPRGQAKQRWTARSRRPRSSSAGFLIDLPTRAPGEIAIASECPAGRLGHGRGA